MTYVVNGDMGFNPRICKRCDYKCNTLFLHNKGFNPRICKRCDFSICKVLFLSKVSIHASVKDATCHKKTHYRDFVSIHASVKDATPFHNRDKASLYCFNPRICKRCDYFMIQVIKGSKVSIHASVKDATKHESVPFCHPMFQSTHL